MADDAQSIRSLNWRELFPFINLFRAFRIAIHPSKLVLGFALLMLIYGGGRVLDCVWPTSHYTLSNEIDKYTVYKWSHDQSDSFDDQVEKQRVENAAKYREGLVDLAEHNPPFIKLDTKNKNTDVALAAARRGEFHSDMQAGIVRYRNKLLDDADKSLKDDLKAIDDEKDVSADKRADERRYAKKRHDATYSEAQANTLQAIQLLDSITPRPIFDSFFEYESRQFRYIVHSVLNENWFNGITTSGGDISTELAGNHQVSIGDPNVGVLRCTANLTLIGPGWLLRYHTVYFILFAIWFLLVWAVFGGALARIAGVHVARDEKISVRQALRFSTSKLLSFVFAPVIPLIIIVGAGALVGVGGLLMYIPVIGPIAVGALFIIALLAALIMTLVATGTVVGFNLMYPTIAVEGSDSFDAISRSFSYVFARPWRMIFYTAVSLVYGALCFLFVRMFVYVMLGMTHFFVQWFLTGQPSRYWNEIWPAVSDQGMAYQINFQALAWPEALAAILIAMWVYIVLAFMASFVISFYFSSNTIIYYLMRREVDATELDDVYVEETEEDFAEIAAPVAPVTPSPAAPGESVPPVMPTT